AQNSWVACRSAIGRDDPSPWIASARCAVTGVLSGLFRVRSFTQDDAHLFVRPDAGARAKLASLAHQPTWRCCVWCWKLCGDDRSSRQDECLACDPVYSRGPERPFIRNLGDLLS